MILTAKLVLDKNTLFETARQLKSDDGENPEYDRALVELCTYSTGNDESNLKENAQKLGINTNLWD